jgi:hypothetical protein
VYPISSVFYEGLRSSSSRPLSPSSTRYSFPRRSVPDNDDSFILFSFLFLMCTNRRKKEAREREVVLFFSPLFIHLFMYTKYAPAFCWMPAEELVYYNVSVSASLSLSLSLCVAFHFNSR